ncbi:MAG TPA: lysylphosphatidylglycerol synthase transmembrane domain-containing protein [Tepidisphaeraceae bacterium]|jgi:hypothetical protein
MNSSVKKWSLFVLRWTIAIVGVWWVVANLSLRDHALVLDQNNVPHDEVVLAAKNGQYDVIDYQTHRVVRVGNDRLVNEPDRKTVELKNGPVAKMLGLDLTDNLHHPEVLKVLVQTLNGAGQWISPDRLKNYQLQVPHPRVQTGLISMIQQARPALLFACVGIFPITILLCSYRWMRLMRALDIHISYYKTFVLYMVGNFYNTFLPGSTGGDVLKAVYVSRLTPHRTRAVVSVLFDRVIGLLALVMLGGAMAARQYANFALHGTATDPAARKCMQVAIASAAILTAAFVGFYIIFHPNLRRRFDSLIARLPAQEHIRHVLDVLEIYRQRHGLILWALVITLPVHITVVISAMLAGMAFGLPILPMYYFVVVPVVVLVGAIPISPQGAGVMEFFAVLLLQKQGATVGQAVALTMSIRIVQILWNLVGGIWVAFGGYHAPTVADKEELEHDV